MIALSAAAAALVRGSYTTYVQVESWLGSELLASDIPIVTATESGDRTLRVPERLTLTVPREVAAQSWVPTEPGAPLGAYGQRLRVSLGVGRAGGEIEYLNRGWFLINDAQLDGDLVSVEALGLLALADEAPLVTEYQPAAGASLGAIVRDLLEPGLTVDLDSAPAPSTAVSAISWSDNRVDAVYSVLDAWGADGAVSEDGTFVVRDATGAGVPVGSIDDGAEGTVLNWGAGASRDGAFNYVVAKGTYPDTAGALAGQEIIATAYDSDPASPFRYGGPFSPYPVPYTYASPLLTTKTQAARAAQTVLARLKRKASRRIDCQLLPNPALQLGDVLTVTSARLGISGQLCSIEALQLPYVPGDNSPMLLTLRTV